MTPYHRRFWFLLAASSLTFMGCAASADPATAGEAQALASEQAGAAGAAAKPQRRAARGRNGHDPAALIQRLDANRNGALEVTELPQRAGHLASADANGDGQLSVAELRAHHAQRRRARFERDDANRDGSLSADELGPRWARVSVADADGNSLVSLTELEQAMAEGKLRPHDRGGRRPGGRRAPPDPAGLFKKLDANADGVLEASELPERKRERWTAADQNQDRRITQEELTTFFEQRRKSGRRSGAPADSAPRSK